VGLFSQSALLSPSMVIMVITVKEKPITVITDEAK
jgi:hypothetical protein